MSGKPDKSAILGLDIGTTNCKLTAFSCSGDKLAEAAAGYNVRYPQPGFAEIDPADIMSAVASILRTVASDIAHCHDLSLAISAQGEAFVLVDIHGAPLTSAPVSIDMRGRDRIAAFNARTDVQDASKAAGQSLNALTSLAKLLWFKEEFAEVLLENVQVLCVGEYVMRQLGIPPAMDYSIASRTGLLDNFRLQWSPDLIELAGLSESIFPRVVPSGALLGTIEIETARQFGLNHSIDVYAGGHDQLCAMLGAGVVTSEMGLYSVGTTEAIALTMDEYPTDLLSEITLPYPHVIAGRYVSLMGSQSGGRLLDWLMKLRGIGQADAMFVDLPDLPSPVTVLPHFAGSGSVLADENARGLIADLNFQTTPQELTHAMLEGITMEQALALKLSSSFGAEITRMRAVGGGSRSAKWMQIKADITGLPIDCMENPDTASAGAAMLAGIGSGALASLEEAVSRFARLGTTYRPRPEYTHIYREKLNLYYDLYRSLKPLQARQSALAARIEALSVRFEDNG